MLYYHFTNDRVTHGPFDTVDRCYSDAASNPLNWGKKMVITAEIRTSPVLGAVVNSVLSPAKAQLAYG